METLTLADQVRAVLRADGGPLYAREIREMLDSAPTSTRLGTALYDMTHNGELIRTEAEPRKFTYMLNPLYVFKQRGGYRPRRKQPDQARLPLKAGATTLEGLIDLLREKHKAGLLTEPHIVAFTTLASGLHATSSESDGRNPTHGRGIADQQGGPAP